MTQLDKNVRRTRRSSHGTTFGTGKCSNESLRPTKWVRLWARKTLTWEWTEKSSKKSINTCGENFFLGLLSLFRRLSSVSPGGEVREIVVVCAMCVHQRLGMEMEKGRETFLFPPPLFWLLRNHSFAYVNSFMSSRQPETVTLTNTLDYLVSQRPLFSSYSVLSTFDTFQMRRVWYR